MIFIATPAIDPRNDIHRQGQINSCPLNLLKLGFKFIAAPAVDPRNINKEYINNNQSGFFRAERGACWQHALLIGERGPGFQTWTSNLSIY